MKPAISSSVAPAHASIAEFLLRLALGFFFLFEALGKFMKGYAVFTSSMSQAFTGTVLPGSLVSFFFHLVPFLELIFGLWILSGWKRVWSLFLTGIYLIVLLFGHLLTGMPYEPLFILIIAIAMTLNLPAGLYCSGEEKETI